MVYLPGKKWCHADTGRGRAAVVPACVENFLHASADQAAGGIHRAAVGLGEEYFVRTNPVNLFALASENALRFQESGSLFFFASNSAGEQPCEAGTVVTERENTGEIHRPSHGGVYQHAPPRIPDAEDWQSQQR